MKDMPTLGRGDNVSHFKRIQANTANYIFRDLCSCLAIIVFTRGRLLEIG